MTPKQSFIASAYGEAWHKLEPFTDENGWVQRKITGHGKTNGMEFENPGFERKDVDLIILSGDGLYKWRPITLHGVEKNNGWIRCDERLPDDFEACRVVVNGEVQEDTKFGEEIQIRFSKWPERGKPTHWQPVQKLLPPIY